MADTRAVVGDLQRRGTNPPIVAAKNATRTIPIVMLNGNFPVETGLVENLAHPGGNVTGTSYISPETLSKQMKLLKEIVPRARRVAAPGIPVSDRQTAQIMRAALSYAADSLRMSARYHDVRRCEETIDELQKIASGGTDAVFYSGSPVLRTRTDQIMDFLRDQKLASIATIPLSPRQADLFTTHPTFTNSSTAPRAMSNRILGRSRRSLSGLAG